jgi:hypothetical protein
MPTTQGPSYTEADLKDPNHPCHAVFLEAYENAVRHGLDGDATPLGLAWKAYLALSDRDKEAFRHWQTRLAVLAHRKK